MKVGPKPKASKHFNIKFQSILSIAFSRLNVYLSYLGAMTIHISDQTTHAIIYCNYVRSFHWFSLEIVKSEYANEMSDDIH